MRARGISPRARGGFWLENGGFGFGRRCALASTLVAECDWGI